MVGYELMATTPTSYQLLIFRQNLNSFLLRTPQAVAWFMSTVLLLKKKNYSYDSIWATTVLPLCYELISLPPTSTPSCLGQIIQDVGVHAVVYNN